MPVLNQVESHPWLPQHELRAFHERHGIVTQAWSPLGRGRLLGDPVLGAIGERYGVTAAQVIAATMAQRRPQRSETSDHGITPTARPSVAVETASAAWAVLSSVTSTWAPIMRSGSPAR